jgi:predicted secreted protein
MRRLEVALTPQPQTVRQLAAAVYGVVEPTRSQVETVRRAVVRLGEMGHAEVAHRPVRTTCDGRAQPVWRRSLTARTPMTDEERRQERRTMEAALARVRKAMARRIG